MKRFMVPRVAHCNGGNLPVRLLPATVDGMATDIRLKAEALSREEGRALLDRSARRELGISGEEFLTRWDAGEYADDGDGGYLSAGATAMLTPFAR